MANKEYITEQWFQLSLHEITDSFGVSEETIIAIVDEGIVSAKMNEQNELLFDSDAVCRIRTVLRLNKDLGINLAGAGLVLELLAEIERLRNRL
ncbi:chaperone modulator CbpM [Legionella dresdenensis]|uniref:Chaperone modulator CbpM n=1 Tax=Legionella dresdenensis TaxID=450200 RepID=A0ABV8CE44_9GAMM